MDDMITRMIRLFLEKLLRAAEIRDIGTHKTNENATSPSADSRKRNPSSHRNRPSYIKFSQSSKDGSDLAPLPTSRWSVNCSPARNEPCIMDLKLSDPYWGVGRGN
jgi:hypothetical protein